MIIGTGLLARAHDDEKLRRHGAVVFASGVSNSGETRAEPFAREESLLRACLQDATGPFVYFSTCSVADPDRRESPYVRHKLAMEALVSRQAEHLILRLPQVVGHTPNPHTLTNFLSSRIASGDSFSVWAHARRCLVDVEAVARISEHLVSTRRGAHSLLDVAPPETVSMSELVGIMEATLGKSANYTVVDRGGGASPDSRLAVEIAREIGLDFSPGYTRRVIGKYYGQPHAN